MAPDVHIGRKARPARVRVLAALACGIFLFPVVTPSRAAIYTNEEVKALRLNPSNYPLNVGGTVDNPTIYLLTTDPNTGTGYLLNTDSDAPGISIGTDGEGYVSTYNIFVVEQKATMFYWHQMQIGSGVGSDHNAVIIRDTAGGFGADGSSGTGDGYDYIGGNGTQIGGNGACYNSLTISDGAKFLSNLNGIHIGGSNGNYNSIIVTGAGTEARGLSAGIQFGSSQEDDHNHNNTMVVSDHATYVGNVYFSNGSTNSVTITGGSTLSGTTVNFVGGTDCRIAVEDGSFLQSNVVFQSSRNEFLLTGRGTIAAPTSTQTVRLMSGTTDNLLTITDGALLRIINQQTSGPFPGLEIGSGNFLRLSEGYVAWLGDHVDYFASLIQKGQVLVQDLNGNWVVATDLNQVTLEYLPEGMDSSEMTKDLYADLGGYTIFSADILSVPEPSTWMLVLSTGVLVLMRRLRRKSEPGVES